MKKLEIEVSDSLYESYCEWAARKSWRPDVAVRAHMRTVARDDDVPAMIKETPALTEIRAILAAKAPLSVSDILMNVDYSRPTVTNALERLRLTGDVYRAQNKSTTAGAPAHQFELTEAGRQRHQLRVDKHVARWVDPACVKQVKPWEVEWVMGMNMNLHMPDQWIGNDTFLKCACKEQTGKFFRMFMKKLGRERTFEMIDLIEKRFADYNARRGIELLAMRAADKKEGV